MDILAHETRSNAPNAHCTHVDEDVIAPNCPLIDSGFGVDVQLGVGIKQLCLVDQRRSAPVPFP
jgi:hypothetical protein